jgi:hypothetical protein
VPTLVAAERNISVSNKIMQTSCATSTGWPKPKETKKMADFFQVKNLTFVPKMVFSYIEKM